MGKAASRTAHRITAIRMRDGDTCCYCGRLMRFYGFGSKEHHPERATIEHVLSISHGGTGRPHNLKLAHERCNLWVGAAPFFEKLMLMRWAGHSTEARPRWAA